MEAKLVSESIEAFQGLTERLKGKQYKIDADKNKKITSNDFKILRGEKKPPKKVNEEDEFEELNGRKEKAYSDFREATQKYIQVQIEDGWDPDDIFSVLIEEIENLLPGV
jgi:hypothetical protein